MRCEDCPSDADSEVFETLRSWRAEVARELQTPAYIVFSDATLMAVAESMPTSVEELLGISGIGPVKVERFGEELLAVIRTCAEASDVS